MDCDITPFLLHNSGIYSTTCSDDRIFQREVSIIHTCIYNIYTLQKQGKLTSSHGFELQRSHSFLSFLRVCALYEH